MKKVVLGIMCAITGVCSVFAVVNDVSSDRENSGGLGSSYSYCPIEDRFYLCYWMVKNNCSSEALVTTGSEQQITTRIASGETTAKTVNRGGSLNFSVTLNGVTKSGRTTLDHITINKSGDTGGFKLSFY